MSISNPVAVGVDFGGTSIKLGVCRGDEVLYLGEPIPTTAMKTAEETLDRIASEVEKLRQTFPEIIGVGIGVPGFVDFARGYVHILTNVPGWERVFVKKQLEARVGLPVAVDNDANAMAYAEWRHGAAAGLRHVVAMTLGTGVGGGLILEGRLYRGATYGAGELGQMSIDHQGLPGNYGNLGAVEKYVGNQQIADYGVSCYEKAGKPLPATPLTPRALAEAAAAGDEIAVAVWDQVADWLATSIADVVWVLNPEAIVIGGGVAQAGDVLWKPMQARLVSRLAHSHSDGLRLIPARFGNESGIIGAAALAADLAEGRAV